jgi:hypothetical protein
LSKNYSGIDDLEIAAMLSLDLLDVQHLVNARRMAIVYTAIAAFENSVRDLIKKVLLADLVGVSAGLRQRRRGSHFARSQRPATALEP